MSVDLVPVLHNGELMLALEVTLDDGAKQYRNRYGRALIGAKPAQQDEPKPKRAPRARKKAAG